MGLKEVGGRDKGHGWNGYTMPTSADVKPAPVPPVQPPTKANFSTFVEKLVLATMQPVQDRTDGKFPRDSDQKIFLAPLI